jgi:hypothetical protein
LMPNGLGAGACRVMQLLASGAMSSAAGLRVLGFSIPDVGDWHRDAA